MSSVGTNGFSFWQPVIFSPDTIHSLPLMEYLWVRLGQGIDEVLYLGGKETVCRQIHGNWELSRRNHTSSFLTTSLKVLAFATILFYGITTALCLISASFAIKAAYKWVYLPKQQPLLDRLNQLEFSKKLPGHSDEFLRTPPLNQIAGIFSNHFNGCTFDPTRPVSHDDLFCSFQAAQMTPSSFNAQPWTFLICDKNHHSVAYQNVFNSLDPHNQAWAQHAPILVVGFASVTYSHNGKANDYAQYDTGAATYSLALQASHLGLMAHQIGGFDKKKILEVFNISDKTHVPLVVTALGHPTGTETRKPRPRNPLSTNVFYGEWNKGFQT